MKALDGSDPEPVYFPLPPIPLAFALTSSIVILVWFRLCRIRLLAYRWLKIQIMANLSKIFNCQCKCLQSIPIIGILIKILCCLCKLFGLKRWNSENKVCDKNDNHHKNDDWHCYKTLEKIDYSKNKGNNDEKNNSNNNNNDNIEKKEMSDKCVQTIPFDCDCDETAPNAINVLSKNNAHRTILTQNNIKNIETAQKELKIIIKHETKDDVSHLRHLTPTRDK